MKFLDKYNEQALWKMLALVSELLKAEIENENGIDRELKINLYHDLFCGIEKEINRRMGEK